MDFPSSSAGKESTYNAEDPGSIPGSGRSPGEGIGYPLHYSWASLVAQMVKNPPAMQETWVRSLGWEDPFEEGMATHCSFLAWRIQWTEELGGLQTMGLQRVRHDWMTKHSSASTISFMLITLQSTSLALISSPSFRVSPLKDTCFQFNIAANKTPSFLFKRASLFFDHGITVLCIIFYSLYHISILSCEKGIHV